MKKILVALLILTGCTKVPQDLMQPTSQTLKIREVQSRTFNVSSDKQLLQASVAVLQDMGYTVKESSAEYGVVTATKEASAVSTGQVILCVANALLSGQATPIDKTQYITVTMVVLDKAECNNSTARTTFQRVIVRTDNSSYAETITDMLVYNDFYQKLDKALFFEEHQL